MAAMVGCEAAGGAHSQTLLVLHLNLLRKTACQGAQAGGPTQLKQLSVNWSLTWLFRK